MIIDRDQYIRLNIAPRHIYWWSNQRENPFYEQGQDQDRRISYLQRRSERDANDLAIDVSGRRLRREINESVACKQTEDIKIISQELGEIVSVRNGTNGDSNREYLIFSNHSGRSTEIIYDEEMGWGSKHLAPNGQRSTIIFCSNTAGAVKIASGKAFKGK